MAVVAVVVGAAVPAGTEAADRTSDCGLGKDIRPREEEELVQEFEWEEVEDWQADLVEEVLVGGQGLDYAGCMDRM